MTLQEIKQAVDEGKVVHWKHEGYQVIKDKNGKYLINFINRSYYIGLTWQDGVTINGKEEYFYTK